MSHLGCMLSLQDIYQSSQDPTARQNEDPTEKPEGPPGRHHGRVTEGQSESVLGKEDAKALGIISLDMEGRAPTEADEHGPQATSTPRTPGPV